MAEFLFTAADRNGKKTEGKIDAANEGELRMMLRSQGLRPIKISRPGMGQVDLGKAFSGLMGGNERVAPERLLNFIRQLQVMLNSGVPLVQSLDLLHEQESPGTLKRILLNTKEKIKEGSFLWESLAAYPKVFERVFVALIRAGESSGSLDVMLKRIGKYLENSFRLKRLIKSSMMYPAIVLVIAIGVVSLMLLVVIPKLEDMIVSTGGELPWITQKVINLSHGMKDNFFVIIAGLAIIIYLVRSYIKSPEGRVVYQKMLLSMPLFGDLIVKSGVAKFCRTMSTLLISGVPMVDAIEICKNSSEHIAFEDAAGEIKKDVETGSSFASAMIRQKIFPKMASQMAAVGENTGSMDKMLEKVADFYEEEVESAVQGMMKLIEPIMLVVLGGLVGGLMIAMYLPIFQMAGGGTQ